MCRTLLKTHIISGCDVTSKFGTKAAALKSKPEYYLLNFGESDEMTGFQEAEKYLVQLLQKNSKCNSFGELRYEHLSVALQCQIMVSLCLFIFCFLSDLLFTCLLVFTHTVLRFQQAATIVTKVHWT